MITFNVSWNVTAGTLNWDDVTITHFNDGTQEESSVPETKDLTFTVNPSFTEEKHTLLVISGQYGKLNEPQSRDQKRSVCPKIISWNDIEGRR